jgi:hypothetical protein
MLLLKISLLRIFHLPQQRVRHLVKLVLLTNHQALRATVGILVTEKQVQVRIQKLFTLMVEHIQLH